MSEIDTGRAAMDRRNHGHMKVLAEKEEGTMELKELDTMAIGGAHEDTARGFQTWGILLQATL